MQMVTFTTRNGYLLSVPADSVYVVGDGENVCLVAASEGHLGRCTGGSGVWSSELQANRIPLAEGYTFEGVVYDLNEGMNAKWNPK